MKKNIDKNTGLQTIEMLNSRFTIELIPSNSSDFKDRIEKPKTYSDESLAFIKEEFFKYGLESKIRASGFIRGQKEIKINDIWVPVTTFYSFYYSDSPGKNITSTTIALFEKESIVYIIHTHPTFIDDLFNDAARLWVLAVNYNGDDPIALKTFLAEYHVKFAEATYFARGTAAIEEWSDKSVFKEQGYKLTPLNEDVILNIEVLKQPFMSLFISHYLSRFWKQDPTSCKLAGATGAVLESNILSPLQPVP